MDLAYALSNRSFEFTIGFAGTRENDALWRTSSPEGGEQLSKGGDLEPAFLSKKKTDDGRIWIGFHRIADRDPLRQGLPQGSIPTLKHFFVVDEERCSVTACD